MILFVGQVAREQRDREAFQEVDYRRMFGPLAKWVAQIDDAARIPELISARLPRRDLRPARARSCSALPEDMLARRRRRSPTPAATGPSHAASPAPRDAGASCASCWRQAERPLVIVGGGGLERRPPPTLRAFAEANAPAGRLRRSAARTYSTTDSPTYVGDLGLGVSPALAERAARRATCSWSLGARLGEMTDRRLHAV